VGLPVASQFTLRLAAELEPSRFAALSRDFQAALSKDGEIDAAHAVRAPEASERSVEIPLLQQLLVSFVGVGALSTLIQCFQAYVTRESSLSYELTRDDGQSLKLTAKNFKPENIDQLAKTLRTFLS
jgi:hypothetical protein